MNVPKYKDYILPLIFTKRLCWAYSRELGGGGTGHIAT